MKNVALSKKFVLGIIALLIVGTWWYVHSTKSVLPTEIETEKVERGEVIEIVSETGFAKAVQSVNLAFERGGRVLEIPFTKGSYVEAGATLIKLDASQQFADLTSARARLEAEQIRLQELLSGSDSASLAVTQSSVTSAETALDNAKHNLTETTAQQNQLVLNAQKTLRSSNLEARLTSGERENSSDSFAAPTISGTYTGTEDGLYTIELYNSGASSGASYRVSGLETDTNSVSTVNPTPIGTRGVYIQFPENFANRTTWEIQIPNTRGSSYLTNLNAYNATLEGRNVAIVNAENAVKTAEAALSQSKTLLTQASGSAREERIIAQQALVNQMQATVSSMLVLYNNTTLTAPFSGTITNISTEIGQIVSPTVPVISLISNNNYELTVDISEVDIAEVSQDDLATVTFDAFGDTPFNAHVTYIAPNAMLVDGVRVFAVTLILDDGEGTIRDGLSADIHITTAKRDDVLAIPTRAIFENEDGKFVYSITDAQHIEKVSITTGLRGTNGRSEILTGLTGGETIITFASETALAQIEK